MNVLSSLARVTSRISEIQHSFGTPSRPVGTAFQTALQEASESVRSKPATAAAAEEAHAAAPSPAVPVVEYVTLGGRAVVVDAPARGTVADVGAVPDAAEWADLLPGSAAPYVEMIESAAADTGLDPRLLAGLVWAESTFVPDAVSSAGAIGLAQLMPGTAAGLGVDPWDPGANVRGGARYLADQIERFGSLELGLAAYNAGPGRVIEHDGAPPYTRRYIDRVTGFYEDLGGAS